MDEAESKLTEGQYGFAWGPLEVRRTAIFHGSHCLTVTTDAGKSIDIYVSRTGRSLRVFSPGRGEWKPAS